MGFEGPLAISLPDGLLTRVRTYAEHLPSGRSATISWEGFVAGEGGFDITHAPVLDAPEGGDVCRDGSQVVRHAVPPVAGQAVRSAVEIEVDGHAGVVWGFPVGIGQAVAAKGDVR